jgi:cell fate (sporulation/competence/biofilm development) regulator YlbF (YheA/YmcA/DUF963 family)
MYLYMYFSYLPCQIISIIRILQTVSCTSTHDSKLSIQLVYEGGPRHMRKSLLLSAVFILGLTAIIGCSSSSSTATNTPSPTQTPSPTSQQTLTVNKTKAQICQDLDNFKTALTNLTQLSDSLTAKEMKTSFQQVASTWTIIKQDGSQLSEQLFNQLQVTYNSLSQAINNLSDSETVAEAKASLQVLFTTINQQWQNLSDAEGCPAQTVTPSANKSPSA